MNWPWPFTMCPQTLEKFPQFDIPNFVFTYNMQFDTDLVHEKNPDEGCLCRVPSVGIGLKC